jgi:hypothetical protein
MLAATSKTAWTKMVLLGAHSVTDVDCTRSFAAKDNFRIGEKIGGRTLGTVGLSFARLFSEVREIDVREAQVNGRTLSYSASDDWLQEATGGEADNLNLMHAMAYIHRLMELGRNGPCHVDGRSNFAYMRLPKSQSRCAIHWFVNHSNEWVIGVANVPHPDIGWRSGTKFFCSRVNLDISECAEA